MANAPYTLPNICCRCGKKQASQMRSVNTSQVSITGFYGIAMTTQRSGYSFLVPICDDCCEKMDRSDRLTKLKRIVFSILLSFVFFYWFTVSGYFIVGLTVAIMVYVVLHLTFSNRPITNRSLGEFTGKYFYFRNNEFFKQFALLNPHLVGPLDLKMLLPDENEKNAPAQKKEPLERKTRLLLIFAGAATTLFCGFLLLVTITTLF